ncbi:MAG: hypothetical protein M1825_006073 [Sarcosagium campestre]|nr:MAG: hypothetical protein M1825_006073 [Sarcosagium campestre]
MFSMLQPKSHSSRKRMLSNIYSKSKLQSSSSLEAMSRIILEEGMLPKLEEAVILSKPLDVYEFWNAVTMDMITAYCFGISNSSNFIEDTLFRREWFASYRSRHAYAFQGQDIANVTDFLRKIGIKLVPDWVTEANHRLEEWCLKMCDAAERSLQEFGGKEQSPADQPIVYSQLRKMMVKAKKSTESMKPGAETLESCRLEIASEMLDHLLAGHETSGITLTYLTWEMSRNPDLQAQIRQELLTLSPPLLHPSSSSLQLPSPRDLDALPLLHAIVFETLRRHPAIPGAQPRVTPAVPTSLAGIHDIPAGTIVSASAYCLHRNAEVFPDPESWLPQRWLNRDGEAARARWFWAFGSGGRMCLGSSFAIQELKLLTAAIYSNYETTIEDDEGINQCDGYTTGPEGDRLILKFNRAAA